MKKVHMIKDVVIMATTEDADRRYYPVCITRILGVTRGEYPYIFFPPLFFFSSLQIWWKRYDGTVADVPVENMVADIYVNLLRLGKISFLIIHYSFCSIPLYHSSYLLFALCCLFFLQLSVAIVTDNKGDRLREHPRYVEDTVQGACPFSR